LLHDPGSIRKIGRRTVDLLLSRLPYARNPVRPSSDSRYGVAIRRFIATETRILISFALKSTEAAAETARKGSRRARYRKFGFSIRLLLGRV
jgi:hypothetical protein